MIGRPSRAVIRAEIAALVAAALAAVLLIGDGTWEPGLFAMLLVLSVASDLLVIPVRGNVKLSGSFLAIVTALEVALYYITMSEWLVVVLLLVLATMKFAMVAAFFMHLKFDSPMLRRVFITGIVLAGVVYTVALFTLSVLV